MKRIVFVLIFVLACASQARAATQVTVAQMDQFLAGMQGQADAKVAIQLQTMSLTERVSAAQLAQWQAALPGQESRRALLGLADFSAFLEPPSAEMLSGPPPDSVAQAAIFSRANEYGIAVLGSMDFTVTRTTQHFGDTFRLTSRGMYNTLIQHLRDVQFRWSGQSSVSVSYREGVETEGMDKADGSNKSRPSRELTPPGIFGPLPATVLSDALSGSVTWGYWERNAQTKAAVFRYTVPEGQSNYLLTANVMTGGLGLGQQSLFSGYQGEIAIDPASGAILRITLIATSHPQGILESAIAIYYGPVSLGTKSYNCPMKGVILVKAGDSNSAVQTWLSDVTYSSYHLYRGDVRILKQP